MANTTKLYQDGSDLLLTTNRGNYSVKSDGIYMTARTGEGLTEVPFDITAQAAFENAVAASEYRVSYDGCIALLPLVDEKMEDFG